MMFFRVFYIRKMLKSQLFAQILLQFNMISSERRRKTGQFNCLSGSTHSPLATYQVMNGAKIV